MFLAYAASVLIKELRLEALLVYRRDHFQSQLKDQPEALFPIGR